MTSNSYRRAKTSKKVPFRPQFSRIALDPIDQFETGPNKRAKELDDAIRPVIAEILGIEDDPAHWAIYDCDKETELYLVHYCSESESTRASSMKKYGHIRGVVVSLKYRLVVSKMLGYTPVHVQDHLTIIGGTSLHLPDGEGLPLDRCTIYPGVDGALIGTFLFQGKVYIHSHKRLSITDSKWGTKKTLMDMLYDVMDFPFELTEQDRLDLFEDDALFSPYAHYFVLSHQDLAIASHSPLLDPGYLVYVGCRMMYHPKSCSLSSLLPEGIEPGDELADQVIFDDELRRPTPDLVVINPELTIEQANSFLSLGYQGDDPQMRRLAKSDRVDRRLLSGEFLIVYLRDEAGELIRTYRIESSSYSWRKQMRDNKPNVKLQFFQLTKKKHLVGPTGLQEYQNQFPIFHPDTIEQLRKGQIPELTPVNWTQQEMLDHFQRPMARLENIWACYIHALPRHLARENLGLLKLYTHSVQQVATLLFKHRSNLSESKIADKLHGVAKVRAERRLRAEAPKEVDESVTPDEAETKLLAKAAHHASRYTKALDRAANIIVVSRKNSLGDGLDGWRTSLTNLVRKERGNSLYNIVRCFFGKF